MTTLVDSSVILDVVTEDAEWGDWSASMLANAAQQGRLVINPLIYAEVACGFDRIEDLDEALPAQYFAPGASSMGRRLPRSPGFCVVSPTRWELAHSVARLFHWRPRRCGRLHPPDRAATSHCGSL
jgi:hypothetical protein